MNSEVAVDARVRALFDEVKDGLTGSPRSLPPKLFYDARGARLFEEITRLPEYYPTRTEIGILERCLGEVGELVGPGARLVEFGSGSGEKTWKLLDALERPATCVPIDISAEQLFAFADRIRAAHPEMEVIPLAADYTRPFRLPPSIREEGTTLFFFPGSTVGNFEPEEAREFLANMGQAGGPDCALLLGADRVKEREVLERAYDDAAGVTAAFNRNALRNLNGLLGGDFDPEGFEHRAPWVPEASRIEMRLVSRREQVATLAPDLPDTEPFRIRLAEGEAIVTEHSYKFTDERIDALCRAAGWRIVRSWTDERDWFGVHYLVRG
ncbi:MAG: L-histidine N(alpha)-methyltransferase [Gemmatimonadales bacterium]|nr:MAG: L-histidine N(alpha)-methyltransferase [Gemmatimonadales bacterium]